MANWNDRELVELFARHHDYLEESYRERDYKGIKKVKVDSVHFRNLDFYDLNLNLSYSVLGSLHLESCYVAREAVEVEVSSGSMVMVSAGKTSFYGSSFSSFLFLGCRLNYAELIQSRLTDVSFVECKLPRTKFADLHMKNVLFDKCEFNGTILPTEWLSEIEIRDPAPGGSVLVLNYDAKPASFEDLEPYMELFADVTVLSGQRGS